MTDDNKILFEMYGRYEKSTSRQVRVYAHDPADIFTTSDIIRYDSWASKDIEQLETYLKALKAYRMELASRYNQLETAPVKKVIRLVRERGYGNGTRVFYFITYIDRFEDGERITESTRYEGKDRKKAFDDFSAYIKAHPGIIVEKDIEKKRWEK